MRPFRVHQLLLRGRYYLLLPRLNHGQLRILEERLRKLGYRVQTSDSLKAMSKEGTIHVSSLGYCWSFTDPSDTILPAVPDILSSAKQKVPLEALRAAYVRTWGAGGETIARLTTRIEYSSLWDNLRGSGECGLTPDEHAIASFLLKRTRGRCELFTDFPVDGSVLSIHGRKRYYNSTMGHRMAESTLRTSGERAARNSYLRRDGTLGLHGFDSPTREAWTRLFEGMGDWCYLIPT